MVGQIPDYEGAIISNLSKPGLPSKLSIFSWNINGLQSQSQKGNLRALMEEKKPDILALQETRTTLDTIRIAKLDSVIFPPGYCQYYSCSREKRGVAGVALLTKNKPISIQYGIGNDKHDIEARSITAEFEHFYIVNQYWPHSGTYLKKHRYRTKEWDPDTRRYLNNLRKTKPVLLMGDFNVAHKDDDVYNSDSDGMKRFPGFTHDERDNFRKLVQKDEYTDMFRQ